MKTTTLVSISTLRFVIHSPTPTARKDCGAAETACFAAVFTQLITAGEGHGVHCFVVPIRDDMGNDLPGVTTSAGRRFFMMLAR